eukprot:CAMPEP_0167774334 /NCGR_PEP_ID=MMETSP0111_2-20121227/1942_1 /TAXON_ID=91324 /ORGANISM="Lotharella globosa, Strain CCCM811" /LENGTH=100 /DNA_ID=CAMNT_0007664119 /DNA_START=303 /DNA_END=604 /DNA_ORIENTATION=-
MSAALSQSVEKMSAQLRIVWVTDATRVPQYNPTTPGGPALECLEGKAVAHGYANENVSNEGGHHAQGLEATPANSTVEDFLPKVKQLLEHRKQKACIDQG